MNKPIVVIILMLWVGIENVNGFQMPIEIETDSATFYHKVEQYSKKNKISNILYPVFFKPISSLSNNDPIEKKSFTSVDYTKYNGKIIRNINVYTYDPFGYNLNDSNKIPTQKLEKIGNNLHVKTIPITIRNLLFFKSKSKFESRSITESERLIKDQNFIYDVKFSIDTLLSTNDSIDINISVCDNWSILPNVELQSDQFLLDITNFNIFGSGHRLNSSYKTSFYSKYSGFNINYFVPNLHQTYISAYLQYKINPDKTFIKQLNLERQFYSTLTKWAGGVLIFQKKEVNPIYFADSIAMTSNFKTNVQDFWIGRAWELKNNKNPNKCERKIVASARFYQLDYKDKPSETLDVFKIYNNETLLFLGFGLSQRSYIQDKFIFKFGLNENVPIGRLFETIASYQLKNNTERWYIGTSISWGNYYNLGYLNPRLEYGTFFNSKGKNQGVINGNITYFTDLMKINKWNMRQFFKASVVFGENRLPTDHISLKNEIGFKGFNSNQILGNRKAIFFSQTQFYAPWNIFGFRFGPYATFSLGMLGNNDIGFKESKIFSQFGLGLLIKNEYLAFKYFQVSIAYYPSIPDAGDNIFKLNSIKSTDLGFNDFYMKKPDLIKYQ